MEREKTEKDISKTHQTVEEDCFSQASALVTDWMLDFLFVTLCRNFKDANLDEFNKNLLSFQAISDDLPQNEKVLICAFLSRIMHGQQLDVIFEEDNKVSPLMSAAKIWNHLKETVNDESLARNLTILLIVQAVVVCLEKGSNASYALQWFERNIDLPSTLRVKLGTVVAQKDIYHPFIQSFSYSRLLETTKTFVDAFLEKNPSDYLLKVATKAVQSSGSRDTFKDKEVKDNFQTTVKSSTANVNKENEDNTLFARSKRRLLATRICDIWTPEACKKPSVCLKRLSKIELSHPHCNVKETDGTNLKKRKPRTKWSWEEDKQLIAGVKRHGLGQWAHILQDYDFGDRTGVMLKDRWRTLRKASVV
ncbi:hypothetical protein NL108_001851 [Boleophthalmus pectinirostris]|uniref:telomeric repeat-binding factor 1 n=1 Tax=Boleophthalmus pectinirostris TaxID=150288 RepID=UPI00242D8105|nr:telomeric repeat-binding factor 1 [Boleophthalmus pectinirostris]KAJ0059514.1 hypothetical protein NL108_001851 [Boleophthalmus pectinirostris]